MYCVNSGIQEGGWVERQRWSNDEMRATDERGSNSRDGESKQAESWSSDNRAGSVTC